MSFKTLFPGSTTPPGPTIPPGSTTPAGSTGSDCRRLFIPGFLSLLLIWMTSGLQTLAADTTQWRGYLVDKSCRASIDGDSQPLGFIRAQTRECALLPSCRQAGYSVYASGKWFNLDKNGNSLAVKLLLASKRTKTFYVLVEGKLSGSTIAATRISELDEPASSAK